MNTTKIAMVAIITGWSAITGIAQMIEIKPSTGDHFKDVLIFTPCTPYTYKETWEVYNPKSYAMEMKTEGYFFGKLRRDVHFSTNSTITQYRIFAPDVEPGNYIVAVTNDQIMYDDRHVHTVPCRNDIVLLSILDAQVMANEFLMQEQCPMPSMKIETSSSSGKNRMSSAYGDENPQCKCTGAK